jgi:hypothetical protein
MAHYEAVALIAEGFAKLAMISVMLRRLTEPRPGTIIGTSESGSEWRPG